MYYPQQCIWLPPIQFYELSRFSHIQSWQILKEFAEKRNNKGSTLLQPVYIRSTEHMIGMLPGDDGYPLDDPCSYTVCKIYNQSTKKLRQQYKNIHRLVFVDMYNMYVDINIRPLDDHLSPQMRKTVINAKL